MHDEYLRRQAVFAHEAREILGGIIHVGGVEGADDRAGAVAEFHRELRINRQMNLRQF